MKNFVFLTLLLVTACEEGGSGGSLSFGTSGSGSAASGASSNAYAYLEVSAALVSGSLTGSYVRIATCQIDAGSPSGTDYDCPSFAYDEGTLYNSKLKFKWGTNNATECPVIKFYPYYYRASNSATFAPEWLSGSTVDCSDPETSDSASCYGGIAPLLSALSFPTSDFFVSLSTVSASDEIEVDASINEGRLSNRMVTNPPSTYVIGADRSMADGSDGIVTAHAGAYTGALEVLRPYKVVCEDSFADPLFTLNFYLRDYDTIGPPPGDNANDADFNDYGDWDSTDNTIDPN